MAAATGVWNHLSAAGQAFPNATAMDTSTSSTDSGDSATISANDFLSLLVTEMQNQDPTADTDPNEYINQLVNVNSLEQLISINQTLSTAMGTSGGTTPTGGVTAPGTSAEIANGTQTSAASQPIVQRPHTVAAHGVANLQYAGLKHAPGNLGIPDANPAAERVAKSLGGQPHTYKMTDGLH